MFQVAAGRLGDVIGYMVLPLIANKIGYSGAVWLCTVSVKKKNKKKI